MSSNDHNRRIYEELANQYSRDGLVKLRDWFLVLAADAALTANRPDEAERLRQRLLHYNPHHLLRPFASFAEALRSPDVLGYVKELRRTYPPQTSEGLLEEARRKETGLPAAVPDPPRHLPDKPLSYFEVPGEPEPELKVFRGKAEPEHFDAPEPPPRSLPRPQVRPAPPPKTPISYPRANPETTAPRVQPAYPPPKPREQPRQPSEPEEHDSYLAALLFVLLLLAGIGLTVYSFARPFLPVEWFP